MDLYDKRYVYFEWDDSLEGKEGFFADCIDVLVARVNDNVRKIVDPQPVFGFCSYGSGSYPFSVKDTHYRFFYYDPLYEYKWAWKNGEQIQSRSKVYIDAEWVDDDCPDWNNSCEAFRVKPEKNWRPFKDITELKQAWGNKWDPLVHPELVEPLIWVRDKKRPDITRLITDFNAGSKYVALAGHWHILEGLFDDYEFLDGTPCGVEE